MRNMFLLIVVVALSSAAWAQTEGAPGEQPAPAATVEPVPTVEPSSAAIEGVRTTRSSRDAAYPDRLELSSGAVEDLRRITAGEGASRSAGTPRSSRTRTSSSHRRSSSGSTRRSSGGGSSYSASMARLRQIADEGRAQIDAVRGVIREEVRPRLSALEAADKAQDARITAVEGTVTATTGAVTALDTRVGEAQGRLDRLEEAVGAKALKRAEARLAAATAAPAEGGAAKPAEGEGAGEKEGPASRTPKTPGRFPIIPLAMIVIAQAIAAFMVMRATAYRPDLVGMSRLTPVLISLVPVVGTFIGARATDAGMRPVMVSVAGVLGALGAWYVSAWPVVPWGTVGYVTAGVVIVGLIVAFFFGGGDEGGGGTP